MLSGLDTTSKCTHPFRGTSAISMIEKYIDCNELDILIVGAGLDSYPFRCPYEPYNIAAFLEDSGINYSMTIIDIDPVVTEDIQNRRNVYFAHQFYQQTKTAFDRQNHDAWDRYLRMTGQQDYLVHQHQSDLIEQDIFYHNEKAQDALTEFYRQGIHMARIPESFESGLETGTVSLINADITDAGLGNYDFINCQNMLYHLSQNEQKKAISNMANSLRHGGYILVNDRADLPPLFQEIGGWLGTKEMNALHLETVEILDKSDKYICKLLRKI